MFDWFKKKDIKKSENRKDSKEPWVQVVGEDIDPERGIKIELDWNDAFVKYLKNSGYTGTSDEAIVQKWLAHMYQHTMETMNPNQTNTFE
jgi:hypothetical protein